MNNKRLTENHKRAIRYFDSVYEKEHRLKPGYDLPVRIQDLTGRITSSISPRKIFEGYSPRTERVATLREVVDLRQKVFFGLCERSYLLNDLVTKVSYGLDLEGHPLTKGSTNRIPEVAKKVLELFDQEPLVYGIWKVRLTTSTSMVRTKNSANEDTVFFYDNTQRDIGEIVDAMSGTLSDGGIKHSERALNTIRKNAIGCMTHTDFVQAHGGNFSGIDLLYHPIFSSSIGDEELAAKYVLALQILSLMGFYHQGLHSLWRPGEMEEDFGRLISLGFKGETFYPPNNSTVGHSALILPKRKHSKIT